MEMQLGVQLIEIAEISQVVLVAHGRDKGTHNSQCSRHSQLPSIYSTGLVHTLLFHLPLPDVVSET